MKDVTLELLEQIEVDFKAAFEGNKKIASLYAKVRDGAATYKDAHEFAIETGETLAKAFQHNLSSAVLPDGRMYYNIANRIIPLTFKNNYEFVSEVASQVQESLNEAAGIGIKAVKPELNEDRINGIVNRVSSEENFDEVKWILDEPVVNFTQSVVDDTIRANADFQYKAGLNPKIIRTVAGKCCEWCSRLAGVYDYSRVSNTGNDVFRRHERCRCTVEFDPGSGKRQNVHTKGWRDVGERDKLEERKYIGLTDEQLTPQERSTRANWQLSATSGEDSGTIREEIGSVPVEKAEETIWFFNEQIRNKSVEHAIVIDKNGNVVHFVGHEDDVNIFDVDLDGAYVTHNHPESNGIMSFGENDFVFLRENKDIALFSCCNPEYEYDIRVLKPFDKVVYNQIYLQGMINSVDGDDLQDKAIEVLAEMGYVKYDKRRIK